MAFPIPSHLPRKKDPQDVSTKILTKISEADTKSLNATLASSWIAELDETLTQTKENVHERIANDLSSFNEQLSSAKSIQERLRTLTGNVDQLTDQLSNEESGVVPTLLRFLTRHAALAQESLDAEINYGALSHILRCKDMHSSFASLVQQGKLSDAVRACGDLEITLGSSPSLLDQSSVMVDLKRSYRTMKARTEEQLNDAYTRSVRVSPSDITVRTSVQVRQSETLLSLSSVFCSLSTAALASHLTALRRDITTLYIDHIVRQPLSITITSAGDITGTSEHKLTLFPDPPNVSNLASRLRNLSTVFSFLNQNLFPHLPSSERTAFPLSVCKPLRNAILNHFLIPSLPSSVDSLPAFVDLVQQACQFEDEYICAMLGDSSGEREISTWAHGVSLHYERKRRTELLEMGRLIVTRPEDESRTFYVDLEVTPEDENQVSSKSEASVPDSIEEDAWGFEATAGNESQGEAVEEESGWDFEDEAEPEPDLGSHFQPTESETHVNSSADDEDPGDAWAWNDDDVGSDTLNGDDPDEHDPWDDGWQDDPGRGQSKTNGSAPVPKPAKRLEQLSSKGKIAQSSSHSPPIQLPAPAPPPQPAPLPPAVQRQVNPTQSTRIKESYIVSGRAKELILHTKDVLEEGAKLASAGMFSGDLSNSPIGSTLSQAAPLTLELFRAVYPVRFSSTLGSVPKRSMRFSNDCLYLSMELSHISTSLKTVPSSIKEKLDACRDHLKLFGESWYRGTIDRQCQSAHELLDQAGGFVDTTTQDRFDECENAVNQVLRRTRHTAQQWKAVLNKSKYYDAIGIVVDAVLSRILADILDLPDITEAESHRLSELCRILNALEGLFTEDPEQPSFVVAYVPSWLKFSYLSELLEASIADISYLFEEGALVDFEIDELVKLVQALFADTPLRANTIAKLLRGHPSQP